MPIFGVIVNLNNVAKLLNIQNNILRIQFENVDQRFDIYYQSFLKTELGLIHQAIPWDDLCKIFKKHLPRKSKCGRTSYFSLQGKIALMFLKQYLMDSDAKIIARLNSDYVLQFFCGIYLRPEDEIKDKKLISQIRCELAGALSIDEVQVELIKKWKLYLKDVHIGLVDATCYESLVRYPTDVKLLWECCEWVYGQMKNICKSSKQKMPRTKYSEQKTKYLIFQKQRKKTHKQIQKRRRSLLPLLSKLLSHIDQAFEAETVSNLRMPPQYFKRIRTIRKIYAQQLKQFKTGEPIENRIVSIAKDYLRPIVRGKEVKPVEFGAKANCVQIDGINFIEHISFNSFNEGTRLKKSIFLVRKLTGKCTHMGADQIYATNKNRTYCSKQNIKTNFVPKGKPGPLEEQRSQMQSILSKERATRLEGSFGTEKIHYGLSKINARTKANEILCIFFGIHTANAVDIGKRISKLKKSKKSA
jgi:Transposase DDE domain